MIRREGMAKRSKKKKRIYPVEPPKEPCPNCGKIGRHYVPPSFGEEGFFFCVKGEKKWT